MCGFAGVIAWEDRFAITRQHLARMSARIAHRGPDGEGICFLDQADQTPLVALAHRRLAIIDPDPRANQPFTDSLGRQLVFNGEIYNFRELRRELSDLRESPGWRTQCDTEVLLAAYDTWGERCCDKLDGMFAFAIYDPASQSVFLARDRMGQKPLYLAIAPSSGSARIGAVAFASELGALREVPWIDRTIDQTSLGHYLRWGYIPGPMTIHRGCEKLPPARWMRIDPRRVEARRYFDANTPPGLSDASGRNVRRLVIDAVSRQLVSDVPLGCFLSGGIDSSIIAAAMKSAVDPGQEVLTFSIGFDDPRYDETPFAAEVARHLGTTHRQFIVHPNAADDLPRLAEVFGEPFGDSSALPAHYLARETRNHVKVALSGDGGDEMFAGYERYRAMLLAEAMRDMPPILQDAATASLCDSLPTGHPKSRLARVRRMLASMQLPAARRYDSYMRLFDDNMVAALCPDSQDAQVGRNWLTHEFESLARNQDAVQTAMALDRVTYLPEDLHTKVDRAAMLHALEVRAPFMDPAIVRFSSGLTTRQLLGSDSALAAFTGLLFPSPAKRLLRDAFAPDLPKTVFRRRKMGFAVPIGEWFRGPMQELLHDSLTAAGSLAMSRFDADTISRLLAEHQAQRVDHSQRLYALLMLELWHRASTGPATV